MAKVSRVVAVGVVGVLAVMGSGVAQDKVLMRLNLEVGQVYSYKMTTKTDVTDLAEASSELTAAYSLTVKSKSEKEYAIEAVTTDQKMVMRAMGEVPLPTMRMTMQFDTRGQILEMKVTEPAGTELPPQMMDAAAFPVEAIGIGSVWTQKFAGSAEYGIKPGTVKYSVKERKTYKSWDVLVVNITLGEMQDGFELTGQTYFDVKSGMGVLMKSTTVMSVPQAGQVNSSMTMELVSVK